MAGSEQHGVPERIAVDPELVEAFVRVIAVAIQVKGSFYHPEGRKQAIRTILARVISRSVNEPGAFVDPPPRLAGLYGSMGVGSGRLPGEAKP